MLNYTQKYPYLRLCADVRDGILHISMQTGRWSQSWDVTPTQLKSLWRRSRWFSNSDRDALEIRVLDGVWIGKRGDSHPVPDWVAHALFYAGEQVLNARNY